MTDKACYARILAEKFDYTNTFYDREPRLDFTESHEHMWNEYDFILSSDVFEHVAPPVESGFLEVHRLLKPTGFFVSTMPCSQTDEMREHFPDLYQYRIVPLGDTTVLINRRRDGRLELRNDLVFHGGAGATLEMREFGLSAWKNNLLAAGFREVDFFLDDLPDIGIVFDADVSQPIISRKAPFAMSTCARAELVDLWRAAEDALSEERSHAVQARAEAMLQQERFQTLARQIQLAAKSRWLRLGRQFGIGPNFTQDIRTSATSDADTAIRKS
jgi:SAM-dependent methyltransferase